MLALIFQLHISYKRNVKTTRLKQLDNKLTAEHKVGIQVKYMSVWCDCVVHLFIPFRSRKHLQSDTLCFSLNQTVCQHQISREKISPVVTSYDETVPQAGKAISKCLIFVWTHIQKIFYWVLQRTDITCKTHHSLVGSLGAGQRINGPQHQDETRPPVSASI